MGGGPEKKAAAEKLAADKLGTDRLILRPMRVRVRVTVRIG